jgi:hypothetical protein
VDPSSAATMSQPEWMQKFNQIGQKSAEDVITFDEGGNIIKTEEAKKKFGSSPPPWLAKPKDVTESTPSVDDDNVAGEKPTGIQAAQSDDDVAAAMFAAPVEKPVETKSDDDDVAAAMFAAPAEKLVESKSDDDDIAAAMFAAPAEKPVETKADDDDVAAAMFAAPAEKPVETKSDDDDIAAAMFASPGASGGESIDEEIIIEESVDEEIIEESVASGVFLEESVVEESVGESFVDESVVSSSVDQSQAEPGSTMSPEGEDQKEQIEGQETQGAEEAAADAPQTGGDEDFGERWVVDKQAFIEEVSTGNFQEEEVARDDGHEHYEDVYVDEHGNEIMEDVDMDDDGNNIAPEAGDEFDDEGIEEGDVDRYVPVAQEDEAVVTSQDDDKPPSEDDKPPSEDAEPAEDEEPAEPPYDPDYDIENQRKLLQKATKGKRSRMNPLIPFFTFLAVVAGVLLILFLVVLDDDDGTGSRGAPSTPSPTPIDFLQLNPTSAGNIEVAATTALDPVQEGNCDFDQLTQPHVIDQCACLGEISILSEDVRVRYQSLVESVMPSVVPDFDETISSCSPSNQALVWLSTGINNGGEAEEFVRTQRYSLAFFYIEQGGTDWRDNSGWLSGINVCSWDRVTCDENRKITVLDLDRNRLEGQVSFSPTWRCV